MPLKKTKMSYFNFSKTFDKVDFGVTLEKLKITGVHGKVGWQIQFFLINQTTIKFKTASIKYDKK